MHGTTLHLPVILFPVHYMEKRFALETRGKQKEGRMYKKKKTTMTKGSVVFSFVLLLF